MAVMFAETLTQAMRLNDTSERDGISTVALKVSNMLALQGPEVEMVLLLLLLAAAEVALKAQESESKVAADGFMVEGCWH